MPAEIAPALGDGRDYDMKQRLELNWLVLLSSLLYLIGRDSTCSEIRDAGYLGTLK